MNENKIEIISNSHYERPNFYALFPILEATLDLKTWNDHASNKEYADKLKKLVPELKNHTCSKGYKGGFIERLEEGTYPEHIIEHMTIALQNMVGANITYGKSRKLDESLYKVAVEYENKSAASEALKGSVEILNSLYAEDKDEEELQVIVDKTIKKEKEAYQRDRLGPSTKAILDAAKRKDIPIEKLHDEYSFYALGQGKYRKNIWGPVTSETSMIGGDISKDKKLCKEILYKNGFPVPRGELARTKDEVLKIAEEIGYPVILKPVKGHHGDGVLGDLRSKEEILKAYDITSKYSNYILVEDFVKGEDYRFLVINHKVIAAANRIPAHVVGDGLSTVEQLIEEINEDPRRGEGHESTLTKIKLGEEEKAHLKLTGKGPDYIPDKDEKVFLRIGGNLSTGGTSKDVTNIVNRSIIEEVERLSKVIDMDILGVDIVAEDITRHRDENEWYIIETNASPGLRMHIHPNEGRSKSVGEKIVEMLFPEHNGRIPIISVTGTNGKTTTSRLIDWIARQEGYTTGLTVTDGIWIDGKKIIDGDTTGPWSAGIILNNKDVDFAVFETARGGIIRKGLGFDRCDVGVVTNIREDHIGIDGVKDVYDIFRVKSLVLEVTKRDGGCVINAKDDFRDDLIERSNGKPILFATSFDDKIRSHIDEGGEAFYVKDGNIYHTDKKKERNIESIQNIPFVNGGVEFLMENLLAAIAASYSAGLTLESIKKGIRSFRLDENLNPGRMNIFSFNGYNVILDYAHNPDCFKALGEYVNSLKAKRNIGVFTVPGDRDDEMMKESTEEMEKWSDFLILTENPIIMRGRKKGDICRKMEKGIGFPKKKYAIFPDYKKAIKHAFDISKKDDLIVLADLDVSKEDVYDILSDIRTDHPLPEGLVHRSQN